MRFVIALLVVAGFAFGQMPKGGGGNGGGGSGSGSSSFTQEWVAAITQDGVAATGCSTPQLNAPLPEPVEGSNTIYGVLSFDDTTDESTQCRIWLPASVTSATLDIVWRGTATTGNVSWCVATTSIADAETGDPALSDVTCVNDAAKGTTLQWNTAQITMDISSWAASEIAILKFFRNADASDEDPNIVESDTFVGDAQLISFRLTVQ